MTYAKCPYCSGPIYYQQYDWAVVIQGMRLVRNWDATFHCTKGCGWGLSAPCDEEGVLLPNDE